jgi:hypothetical protein
MVLGTTGTRGGTMAWLEADSTEIQGSRTSCYLRVQAQELGTAAATIIYEVTGGEVFRIRAVNEAVTGITVADMSGISFTLLKGAPGPEGATGQQGGGLDTVKDYTGSPTITGANTLTISGGTVIDSGGGEVTLQIDAGVGEHTITSHSDVVDATGAQLETLTGGGDTTLHDHAGISENTGARHTQGTDTTLGTMTADIDMDDTYQVTNLQAPGAAGEALRQTTNITEADLEQLTDGSDTTLHDHAGISENTGARHTQGTDTTLGTMTADIDMNGSYQVVGLQAPDASGQALRQTTNITEADLEQLTDGSDTTLHDHAGISENTTARHTRAHNMTGTSDHDAGNHKIFYSDGSGDVIELTHGTDTYVLTSNGATTAPSNGDPISGATDHALVRADGATALQDSGILISDTDDMVLPATSSLECPEKLVIPLNEPSSLENGCIWIA